MPKGLRWSQAEIATMIQYYSAFGAARTAKKLPGRTELAVLVMASRLDLRAPCQEMVRGNGNCRTPDAERSFDHRALTHALHLDCIAPVTGARCVRLGIT